MKKALMAIAALIVIVILYLSLAASGPQRVLVFSEWHNFYHETLPTAQAAIQEIANDMGVEVDTTSDSAWFTRDILEGYDAVLFLYTKDDVLTDTEQEDFMRYIQAGGSYMGIHSASDTEFGWPWYGRLVGGYFVNHPAVQEVTLSVLDKNHPSTNHLPDEWTRTDEWYNFRYTNKDINVLIAVDESSYDSRDADPAVNEHPLAWYHEFDGGKSFFTALGHVAESYSEPLFLDHIRGGLEYVLDRPSGLNYDADRVLPSQTGFQKVVLDENLNEPMELDILPDGRILFVERRGDIKVFDASVGSTELVATLDVYSDQEDGLLGMAIDPDYAQNHWVYLYYSPPGIEEKQVLSRFELSGSPLALSNESVLFEVETQRAECCHSGGSVEFGPDGLLYLSTGDDTNPFESDSFTPIDERPGRSPFDAQRTSGNSQDLRGKILRVRPTAEGGYDIPDGNLFAPDGSEGRPEIYVMGNRNPFRIAIDSHTGFLYWGEVGPDATEAKADRGPRGHDELNQARQAGFYGWPYFVGDNKAYVDFNFSTGESSVPFNQEAPENNSPNANGARILPPAQPAFIWYPYAETLNFPLLGSGGRTAMAGPVYHVGDYETGTESIPSYYDGKLFVYEWMRHMIFAVTLDANADYAYMERFAPNLEFSRPTDMIFAHDGTMYLLEYGTKWNVRNEDARLVRIVFDPAG